MTPAPSPSESLDTGALLGRLDGLLGEVGRRQHRFSWLRDADAEWIAVDAYYPGNRVVALSVDDPQTLGWARDLVSHHDLHLLAISAADLTDSGVATDAQLRTRLEVEGWQGRHEPREDPSAHHESEVRRRPEPEVSRRRASERGERPRDAVRRSARNTTGSEGVCVGVTLVLVVILEVFIGGALIGLDGGQYVLGFGLVLDACARGLGMVVASQRGDLDAGWVAVLVGSPALWGAHEVSAAPAGDLLPAARVIARLAGAVVALGLVIWIV